MPIPISISTPISTRSSAPTKPTTAATATGTSS